MLEDDFLGFINDQNLFGPTDRILLAVSGGLDSVVMADLFQRIGQPFGIAHVNFGLRGAESDDDAAFVQNVAERCGVPFHLTQFDTRAIAAGRGISVQMAARELRYDWFDQLIQQHAYVAVATAHHQNDVLETMLLNLTRGTGLAGLHGIAPRRGHLVRPLLFATRDDLAKYAEERGLTYREDRSNADDKYARNRIRHHVVPVLTALNPGLWQTLPRTVERLRAAETLLRVELARSWRELAEPLGEQTFLPTDKLLRLAEPAYRLNEWLKPFGFTEAQAGLMIASLRQPTGQVFYSATHRVTHDRSGLLLEPWSARADYELMLTQWPDAPVIVPGGEMLHFAQFDKPADFRFPADPAFACFDADRLALPLTLRPWRPGDRFRPLGLDGSKLVGNLLTDLKMSRSEREQTVVLLSGRQIAWVVGRRIDHRFRVLAQTQRIAVINLIKA